MEIKCFVKPINCLKKLICNKNGLHKVAHVVKHGGVVVYPTDTVYGLGCDPFNSEAVERLIAMKRRRRKPLPVLVSDLAHADRLVNLGKLGHRLAVLWPGGLTIVAPVRVCTGLAGGVTCGFDRLGVRVPKHPWALTLISLVGGYLVGTSANRSGEPSPRTIYEAFKSLGFDPDIYLDGGQSDQGIESTVVDVCSNKLVVIRKGVVSMQLMDKLVR